MIKHSRIWIYGAFISVLSVMVLSAELTGCKEIIFPEMTAIAVGTLCAPAQSWNVSPVRLLLTVCIMAFVGVGIVRYIPLQKEFTLVIALFIALSSLTISRCGFVPQLSACVLPVVLGTESLIYPVSATILTLLVLIIQQAFIKKGICQKREFTEIPISSKLLKRRIYQFFSAGIMLFSAGLTGMIYFVVPPLLAGYVEMSMTGSKLVKRWHTAWLLIGIGAVSGVLARVFLTQKLGIPLTISAVIAAIIVLIFMEKFTMFFPPAAAISTLPMLIGTHDIYKYPLECVAGFGIMIGFSLIASKSEKTDT